MSDKARLSYLDSLRGIAILLVVFYHYFYRFIDSGYYAFSPLDGITDNFLFRYGYYGVHLFFVISGFVIAMTLFKSNSLHDFFLRRFARLWPTMALCSVITFLYLTLFGVIFETSAWRFFPSLSFIDPYVFNRVLGSDVFYWMDGAYWSLFVEVRFYALVSIIYFITRHFSLKFLLICFLVYCFKFLLVDERLVFILDFLFFTEYLYLFVLGMGFYFLHVGNKKEALYYIASSFIFFISKNIVDQVFPDIILYTLIVFLFLILHYSQWVRFIISRAWLGSIGIASYSFYLLHQNIGVDFNFRMAKFLNLSNNESAFFVLFTLVVICIFSQLIFKYYEHPFNSFIIKIYIAVKKR